VRSTEIGSCSLQEEQMLRRSVEALIGRRNRYGDRLAQLPRTGLAAPHESQPSPLERGLVRRLTTKRLNDFWIRPDITLGELPGRANQYTRDQAGHRQANLLFSKGNRHSHFAAGAALFFEQLALQSIMTRKSERGARI
jgi:hypothetical protein